MIDGKVRNNLLQELEKSGNVYLSCLKVGVNKATYYRWRKDDKRFRKQSNQAVRSGKENICDMAEHYLMMNVKDKKMDAIKYVLSHNSPRYKPKDKRAFIIHSNAENSESAIALKQKEHDRIYYNGQSDALKKFIEHVGDITSDKNGDEEKDE